MAAKDLATPMVPEDSATLTPKDSTVPEDSATPTVPEDSATFKTEDSATPTVPEDSHLKTQLHLQYLKT